MACLAKIDYKVGFFNAVNVDDNSFGSRVINFVESYFSLSSPKESKFSNSNKDIEVVGWPIIKDGKVAAVQPFCESSKKENFRVIKTALKIITYFTVIIPVLMLLAKAVIRYKYNVVYMGDLFVRQQFNEFMSKRKTDKNKWF